MDKKPVVYLSELLAPSALKMLEERADIVDNFEKIDEIDAMIIRKQPVTGEMMKRAKKLKVISRHGVGCDMLDMDTAKELGITVMTLPGANAQSVAELAVSFMAALSKKLKICDSGLSSGKISTFAPKESIGFEMAGKTLELVGTGHVAARVAAILKGGFGMRVVGSSPHLTEEKAAALGIERFESIEEMFAVADYINISVPLTPATRNMINSASFAKMKPNAILVNTSRGGVVNEKDLYDALTSGTIFAAASDVFEHDPPAQNHPLLSLDNFIATPHCASSTYECMEKCGEMTVENIFKVLEQK